MSPLGASSMLASNPEAFTGTGMYSTDIVPSGMGVSSIRVCKGMLMEGISAWDLAVR
jgi:hypothetical protein